MSDSYFRQDNPLDIEVRYECFYLRSFAIAANFIFAAEALNKGYLVKLLEGGLSSAELADYGSLAVAVAGELKSKIAAGRAVSLNPERFDQMLPRWYSNQFNSQPIPIQYDAKACRLLNGIWFTSEMAKELTNYLAELQTQGIDLLRS